MVSTQVGGTNLHRLKAKIWSGPSCNVLTLGADMIRFFVLFSFALAMPSFAHDGHVGIVGGHAHLELPMMIIAGVMAVSLAAVNFKKGPRGIQSK